MLKKGDIVIIASVAAAAVLSLFVPLFSARSAKTVTVSQNNTEVYRGSIYENRLIKLSGNTVEIKNGSVKITGADCKNQLCVKQGTVKMAGESIICLPNKVIVEVS